MVLLLPITQCHFTSPAVPTLCCEMLSSHCCPRCLAPCEPHLNPRFFPLGYSPCSDCPCLYHTSSTFLDSLEMRTTHSEGFMWWKWREKGKDHLSSVKHSLSSRKGSSQNSLMLVTSFCETSVKKILHQENTECGLHCFGIHLISLQVGCLFHTFHLCSSGRSDTGTSGK